MDKQFIEVAIYRNGGNKPLKLNVDHISYYIDNMIGMSSGEIFVIELAKDMEAIKKLLDKKPRGKK